MLKEDNELMHPYAEYCYKCARFSVKEYCKRCTKMSEFVQPSNFRPKDDIESEEQMEEERMRVIAQNGNTGEHYAEIAAVTVELPKNLKQKLETIISDGSTASYYELPKEAKELQDLISYRDMNAQLGEIFRECFRYGLASHSDKKRGIKKILFYARAELERLEKYEVK